MSNYPIQPLDLKDLHTVSLKDRGGKVRMNDFANPYVKGSGIMGLLQSLPRILAADSFRLLVEQIVLARKAGKPIVWGLGGHVIKCGLSPVLTDLMRRGFARAGKTTGAEAAAHQGLCLAGQAFAAGRESEGALDRKSVV